jgi:Hint domain
MSHVYAWISGSGTYDVAADWSDLTLGATPAPTAPGSLDIVSIAGPTSASFQLITGPGSAASLGFTGNSMLAGIFTAGTLTVGNTAIAGVLDIGAGSGVTAGTASLVSGRVQVSGAASFLTIGGTLTVQAGALAVLNAGDVRAGALALNGGTLQIDATSVLEVGSAGGAAAGVVSVDGGATLVSTGGVIFPGINDLGTVLASGGTTSLLGSVSGNGTLLIGTNATLYMGGAVGSAITVSFTGSGGTLAFYAASGAFAATIGGFAAGDAIDLSGISATSAVYTATGADTGILTLMKAGQAVASLTLSGNYAGTTFLTVPDSVDGTLVLLPSGSIVTGGTLSAGTSGPDAYLWTATSGGMWDVAANWKDVSSRSAPALVAPGAKNIVTLAGPTGESIALIGGPGNSASLIVTGAIALSGVFATGGLTVGTALATGTLDIVAGGTLTTTTPTQINGTLEVSGAGALVSVNGILTVGPQSAGLSPPDIAALNGGYIKTHLLYLNGGTITVDATSTIEVGTPGNAAAGALTVDGGYYINSTGGTITGAVIDKGTLLATGGVTSVFGNITGTGLLNIGAGGTLFLAGSVAATNTVNFISNTGRLMLYGTSGFSAAIAGLTSGDAIDISGVRLTGAVFTAISTSKGTLTLSNNGVSVMTLTLSGNYAGAIFQTSPDGVDGTLITLASGGSGAGLLSAGTTTPDSYRWAASGGGDWGNAANWVDSSVGTITAAVAPGVNDNVTIAGLGTAGLTLLTGQGNSASLALSGNIGIAGRVTTGAVTTAGTSTPVTLDVNAAGTLSATSIGFGPGVLQVAGVGAVLTVSGTLTLGPVAAGLAGPRLAVLNQGLVQAGALVLNGASIVVDSVSAVEIGRAGGAAIGVVTVDAGATLSSNGGVIGSAAVVNGVLLAGSGTTSLLSDVYGSGTLMIGAGATLSVYGVVGSGETVDFAGTAGRLVLNAATNTFSGVITGFVPGDEIDIAAATLTGAVFTANGSGGGTLVLTDNGVVVTSLVLAGTTTTEVFQLLPDGVDGTLIRVADVVGSQAPCYAAGTRILTEAGEMAVEDLRPGVRVVAMGRRPTLRQVRWVGRRWIDIARHPHPERVLPIRVTAGAFGAGMPHRDLLLSPEHAVFVDGVLIPVHLLVNGATVMRDQDVADITYLHVELDRHDIILAEGLPAESYLDTGNRGDFANAPGVARLHADLMARDEQALAVWATKACAELVQDGERLASVRRRLAERAMALGWRRTEDPDLWIVADGTALRPDFDDGAYHFILPRAARSLRLVSRNAVPAECDVASGDHRRLGVAVTHVAADGVMAPRASGGGWYPPEAQWQWTDGNAALDCQGAASLQIRLMPILRYWARDDRREVMSSSRGVWAGSCCAGSRG